MAAAVADRQGKPFQSNMISRSKNKDQYSSKKNEFDPSSKDRVNNSLTLGRNRKEQAIAYGRGRVNRNEQGLASKTNIPNAIDNRYCQLTDRQFDDETARSSKGKYQRMNNFYKHEPTNEKETLERSQHDSLLESQNGMTADQQAIDVNLTNPTHRHPPGSQFYEKTIKYPTSSVDDIYSRQNQASDTRYTGRNSNSYKGHSGYTHSRYRHIGRTRHSLNCSCDECLLGILFGTEGEFDDLEDVPAYDDIPFALLLTKSLDQKTIFRAKRKQEQQLALNSFKEKNEIKNASVKTNKNKNKGLQAMCKEQFDKSRSQSDDIQNPSSVGESGIDIKAKHGKEAQVNTSLSDFSENTTSKLVEKSANEANDTGERFNLRFAFFLNESPTKNDNIQGQVTRNERPKSPFCVLGEEEPFHDANIVTEKRCLKEVKEDENFAKEPMKKEDPNEEDTEKFIRQKRLENLNLRASDVKSKNVTSDSIRIQDNRDIAVNVDKVNKPVKSTAFRSKIPLFPKEETPGQKGAHNGEDTEHKFGATGIDSANQDTICAEDRTKLRTGPDSNPGATAAERWKHGTKEDQKFRQNHDTSARSRNETVEKKTESIVHLKKEPSIGFDKVPSTMKLLKMTEQTKQVKQRSVSKTNWSDNSDDQEKEPVAMRLLRQAKEAKEMKSVIGRRRKKSSGPFLAFIFDLNDKTSEKYSFENKKMLSDPLVNEIDTPKQRNKNKNSNPLKQAFTVDTDKEKRDTRNTDQFDADKQTNGKHVDTGKQSPVDTAIKEQTLTPETEAFNQIAINRHRAFQRLKISDSVERLKCTSCGRSECKSQNIQKLKEIIKMAKHAGFEVRDVAPDGNCMFAAVVDQLQLYSDFRFTPKTLREAAVNWLVEHPLSADGTHYSSFVSGDWDVYIHRMMTEGEWGDHIVLRAVVEVVGHTIKILKVSGNEECWTTLEPASAKAFKDGMHLVLAHVGEYHYTSLRPSDGNISFVPASPVSLGTQQPLLVGDNEQILLEGTETVEMFREDYIDPLSDLPVAHFSYMLRNVVPVKVLDTAAIIQSEFTDTVANMPLKSSVGNVEVQSSKECGGSMAEGIYVPAFHSQIAGEVSSFEADNGPTVFVIVDEYFVVENESELSERWREEFLLDSKDSHPGYTKLRRAQTALSQELSYTYQPNIVINKPDTGPKRICAVRCPFWPQCAQEWKTRLRPEGFPSTDMISSIVSDGCLLLASSHKESRVPEFEWQFSFSLCEKKLFREAVSMYQKYGYILFEGFVSQTMANLTSISSEHLKAVFFYSCERIPAENWQSNPGACVMYMLDELLRYIRNKNLPNYFVRCKNMVAYLKEKDFKEIEEQIILLRSQLALFIRQIDETLLLHPHGDELIDRVCDDIPSFKSHRSVKRSTLEVFVPETIRKAQGYIRKHKYAEGYEVVSQAFQERLSVSTCDDSVPFQMFLPGAVSGLDLDSLVWFSAYTDKQLEGQLSRSLVRETCGDLSLKKIKDILPVDIAGSYGNTEVPTEFSRRLCSFCYEFAKFLFQINKFSEILPILYYCHEIFTKKVQNEATTYDQSDRDDFNDHTMFFIYTAMFFMYNKQWQIEFFRPMIPVFESVVERMRASWAYSCLAYVYKILDDKTKYEECTNMAHQLPRDHMDNKYISDFNSWIC